MQFPISNVPDSPPISLFVVPPHTEYLHHPHKNIDEIQLQTHTLIHHIPPYHSPLSQPRMVQHLLHIIQRESSKDRQPAPQPHPLTPHKRPCCRCWEYERSEAGNGDDCDASQEGAAKVEVFLLAGGGADEGDGAHHCGGVEAGAGEEGRVQKEEWGEDSGLGEVEGRPKGIFLDVAVEHVSR